MTPKVIAPRKPAKSSRGDGVQRLAKACSRTLRDNGDEIAAALFRRAAEGNLPSTRLLLKLIEKHPAARIHRKRFASGRKALLKALADLQLVVDKPRQSANAQE